MTADDIQAAIAAATSLTNPRLSEVPWEAVAAILRVTLTLSVESLPVERLEAGGPIGGFGDDSEYIEVIGRGALLDLIEGPA